MNFSGVNTQATKWHIGASRTFLLAVAVASAGCANLAPLPTPTGKPEVTINGATASQVKAKLVSAISAQGYGLMQDTQYSMVFSKQLEPGEAALVKIGLGNAYSSEPQLNIAFTFAPQEGATRVFAHLVIGMQGVFGQNQGMSLDTGKAAHQIQSVLEGVKASLETRAR